MTLQTSLIILIAACAVAFGCGWWIESHLAEAHESKALANQQAELTESCNQDKAITERANNDLQTKLADNTSRLSKYKRLQPTKCVMPSSCMAELASSGRGFAGQDGIDTDTLREFAKECNDYRSERLIYDQFKTEWEARK